MTGPVVLTESDPVSVAYSVFLRATRPAAVLSLSLIAFVCVSIVSGPIPDYEVGWSPGMQFADASIIVLTLAFGWKSRKRWLRVIWGPTRVGLVAVDLIITSSAVVLAAVFQSMILGLAEHPAQPIPPLVFTAFIGPAAETIIFQGWLQSAIARRLDPRWAFALTSLAFWAIHLSFNAPLIAVVICLCFIRMRTQSLTIVALTHSAYNILVFSAATFLR